MLRRRSQDEREHGQIIVLFALCLVVILAFTAIVVDIGMLRNDRQNLANAMDAGALAGGTVLPVSGQNNNPNADGTTYYQRAVDLIDATVTVDYPGLTLPTIANGGISFRCLIGTLPDGTPDYTQITAGVCNPSNALHHAPGPGFPNDFTGAGPTRSSICQPYNFTGLNGNKGDTCNVVLISGAATQAYGFARVIGINSGSTGTVQSAACNGPCGASPATPVDLVIILDRTGSMAENNGNDSGPKIQSLQAAAKAVLGVYNPALQRVALALTGPGEVNAAGTPVTGSCGGGFGGGSALGVGDDNNFTARANLTGRINSSTTTISVGTPYSVGFPKSGNFSIVIDDEQMLVTGGQGTNTWTVTRGSNGSTATQHFGGTEVDMVTPWVPDLTVGHNTVGMWVPVGLSGTDSTAPLPNPNGAAGTYSINGVVQNNTPIVKAINCIKAYSNGTNLTTPIQMAQQYLDAFGRKGVTQGIILETDGHPQVGFNGGNQWQTNQAYTCKSAIAAATAAKADKTNSPLGIQIFTVGYGVDNTSKCPIFTNNKNADDGTYNMYEGTDATGFNWSGVAATTLLSRMATDAQHYFNNPPSSQLAAVFTQAAQLLSHSGLHLIQPYPAPVVLSLAPSSGPAAGNTSVTVTGEYFTGATKVQIGGTSVGFTVVSDTTITFKTPPGAKGKTFDVIVTTGGGSSPPNPGDQYTYN
ncbi:MAG TPA: IPT/TIG domain-containing protein [Candidatus Limnocylindrales bacterium]|jgi:hypothetical protein